MNRDMNTQVREYTGFFQGSIEPVEIEEILHRRVGEGTVRPVGPIRSTHRRGWVTAAVTAMVTVIVLGSVGAFIRSDGDAPAVDETPPTTTAVTPTTKAAITTDAVVATTTTLAAVPAVPPGAGPRLEFVRTDSPYDSFSFAHGIWFAGALYLLPDGEEARDVYRSSDGFAWELVPGSIPGGDRWGGGHSTQTDGNRLVNVSGTDTWGGCLGADDSLWVNTSRDGIEWTTSEITLSLPDTSSNAGCFTNYGSDFAVGPEGIVVTASINLEVGAGFAQGLVDPDDGMHVEVADVDLEQGKVTIRFIDESTGAVVDTTEIDGFGESLADLLDALAADSGWGPLAETVVLQLADPRYDGAGVTRGFAWFSADGETWVQIESDALNGREFSDIVAGRDGFRALARSVNKNPWLPISADDFSIWKSTDGVSWTETTLTGSIETLSDRGGDPSLYQWNERLIVGSRNGVVAIGEEPLELIGVDGTTEMGIIDIGGLGLVGHANEMDDAGTEVLYSGDGSAWRRWSPPEFGPDPGHLYMMGIGDDFVVLQLQQESEHSLWVGRLP